MNVKEMICLLMQDCTGIANENYSSGDVESRIYDEVGEAGEDGEQEKNTEQENKKEQGMEERKTSVRFGIDVTPGLNVHSYENVPGIAESSTPGRKPGEDGERGGLIVESSTSGMEVGNEGEPGGPRAEGSEGGEANTEDEGQREFEKGIKEGLGSSSSFVEQREEQRKEKEENGSRSLSTEQEAGPSDDSFGELVRGAIAHVDAAHRQGEERLQIILETLEDGMKGVESESTDIMRNIKRLEKITPRRSANMKNIKRLEKNTPRRSTRLGEKKMTRGE